MNYTLSVTSPLTEGLHVEEAQRVLNKGNVYAKDFLQGAVDGVFGEETGRACIRAKYWLGYARIDLRATYGQALDEYLHGQTQPTPAMVKRQDLRGKPMKQLTRLAALAEARKWIGTKESPAGSNIVKFSTWYGIRGPWCAMFVTWCYVKAHSKAFVKGRTYAYVPYIVNDARAGRNGLVQTRDPLPGDVVCYDWDGGAADHTGLFDHWITKGHTFAAVEGNTSLGNDSNGGEVMVRTREVRQVECFVRVGR